MSTRDADPLFRDSAAQNTATMLGQPAADYHGNPTTIEATLGSQSSGAPEDSRATNWLNLGGDSLQAIVSFLQSRRIRRRMEDL